ncbi:uncharacterized protein DDB_G0283697-like isoform X2 [Bacillus rossius redtenbacheri]
MKCPLRPTNKQFLVNTILPTLSTSRRRHYADRRDYYHSYRSDDRWSTSERHGHRSRRDGVCESKDSHSHRDSKDLNKGDRERRKNRDSSPARKIRLLDSNSLDITSKQPVSSGTENKIDAEKNSHGRKEGEYACHKSSKDRYSSTSHRTHKDDKHAHKTDSSHFHKNHDGYTIADQQFKDKELKDCKTEVPERHKKSRTGCRSDAMNEIVHDEFENYKDKGWNDNHKISNTASKLQRNDSAVKDELSNTTENKSSQCYISNDFIGNDSIPLTEKNISNSESNEVKKNIPCDSEYSKQNSGEFLKKLKTSEKIKKDKSKKLKDLHNTLKEKKKRRKKLVASKSDKTDGSGKVSENLRQEDDSYEENKCSNALKVQQCADTKNGMHGQENKEYYKQSQVLESSTNKIQESGTKQAKTKLSKARKNEINKNVNPKAEKRKLKKNSVGCISSAKDVNKNSGSNTCSNLQVEKLSKNKNLQDNLLNTNNAKQCKNLSRYDKNSSFPGNNDGNGFNTESHGIRDVPCTNITRSDKNKALEYNDRHHREKSSCLRDITDEMCHRDTENSERSKRRWSVESD